ncbi:hypothetical protein Phage2-1_00066 [Achromobacter phage 2-1]|nr:hypothetical protein Phage2-1_00066 [Achromobacter phage 2-1]
MRMTPRPHQIADLSFYMQTKRCLNLSDPGAQKTGSAAMYSWYLASEKHQVGLGHAQVALAQEQAGLAGLQSLP